MNIKRAKQEIKDTIEAYLAKDEYGAYAIPSIRQRPMLLIGPPGIGKTQIMEQISQECQIGLVAYTITHHTRQSAIGLPFIEHKNYGGKEYAVTEYTMSEIVASIYDKIEQTGLSEGLLFIDEINCVSETLAPTMLQFLQGKTFGNHKIPQGWIIVAAGNPPEYNKSVREFDIVTMDRIRRMDVEADLGVWMEYAVRANVHPAIRSYLGIRKENFCRIETTVDGRIFATPRGWEDLSELIWIYEKQGKKVDRELVAEYIQFPKIAKDFANYLELYYKYQNDYQVAEILDGKISEPVVEKLQKAPFDEKISVVGLLLSGLNDGFREVVRTQERMQIRMKQMKELQMSGAFETSVVSAVRVFSEKVEAFRADWEKRLADGLLARTALADCRAVSAKMEADLQAVRSGDFANGAKAWEAIRERFGADSDAYEDLVDRSGARLEHAFDFMEAAFGGSQEMVLFVTELNTGFYSVQFLQEYECERYYEYNRNLLFSEEEKEIGELLS